MALTVAMMIPMLKESKLQLNKVGKADTPMNWLDSGGAKAEVVTPISGKLGRAQVGRVSDVTQQKHTLFYKGFNITHCSRQVQESLCPRTNTT